MPDRALDVVGILLAAGSGTRFGGDKLLAGLRGVGHDGAVGVAACRNLAAAIPEVIAVVRPGDTALAAALAGAGARVVECGNAAAGMGASLACGVQASSAALGWIVALADMPWIRPDTIARVADALRSGAPLAAPFHAGERGHPVGFGRACLAELSALGADEGAKSVVTAHRNAMVRIEVDDPGVLRDVDTPRDLSGGP
jgi:molybdenum cofactor cytidylyltransferase